MEEKLSDLDRDHNPHSLNQERTLDHYPMSERYSKMHDYHRKIETDEKENHMYFKRPIRERSAHLPSNRKVHGEREDYQNSPIKPILKTRYNKSSDR